MVITPAQPKVCLINYFRAHVLSFLYNQFLIIFIKGKKTNTKLQVIVTNGCCPHMYICLRIQPDTYVFHLSLCVCLLSLLVAVQQPWRRKRARIERWLHAVRGIKARTSEERRVKRTQEVKSTEVSWLHRYMSFKNIHIISEQSCQKCLEWIIFILTTVYFPGYISRMCKRGTRKNVKCNEVHVLTHSISLLF